MSKCFKLFTLSGYLTKVSYFRFQYCTKHPHTQTNISMKKITLLLLINLFLLSAALASHILIPMDKNKQRNHLKAYGLAYWVLQNKIEMQWLLNYRGGSFLVSYHQEIESECVIRGISFETIPDLKAQKILNEIAQPEVNMDAVKLEKVPKIAVYSPKDKQPWDDAVTLALSYAEIPYDIIYDEEIVQGKLKDYDWLHLHHEDFTGQYGKFYGSYRHMPWYQENQLSQETSAKKLGFAKVSQLKLFVAQSIKAYVQQGGFLFAMCSATDSFDIALASQDIDICETMFDGDGTTPQFWKKMNYKETFAFKDFKVSNNPFEYEFSDIDVSLSRKVPPNKDYFTLFDFSAKWDPIPTMLCQNHSNMIKGFMGQTTAYRKDRLKPDVLVMGQNKAAREARYIHGEFGQGTWTFYGGHDPEDYRHYVGDPPTELKLYPNSAAYRLILNNVLFPAAKKKKLKT